MKNCEKYYNEILDIQKQILTCEQDTITQVSMEMAKTLKDNKSIFLFGCGHSHLIVEEAFYRAGGLVRINPVFDTAIMLHEGASKSSKLEKLESYGAMVFDRLNVEAGDLFFVFSTSGRNGCPIEMAVRAKQAGAKVVTISSLVYKGLEASRHSSGKYLADVADYVIDNHVPYGDGVIPYGSQYVAPTSTVVTAMIWNMLIAQLAEDGPSIGYQPEYFVSGNISGGMEKNERYLEKYRKQNPYL